MASRRAAVSALARACLLHATGLLSHATLPPVAIGAPCPALRLRWCLTHNISTPYLSGTILALFSRQHAKKTRATQSTLRHKEVAHGRVESLARDGEGPSRDRPRFRAGGRAWWWAQ